LGAEQDKAVCVHVSPEGGKFRQHQHPHAHAKLAAVDQKG